MRQNLKLLTAALSVATAMGAFLAPGSALAQQAPAASPKGDDIVVTARRVEERLQDVPLAITALSGKALERQGVKTTEDLRFHVPALQITPTPFGAAVPGYTIRGQRQYEQLLSQDPSVGVYFADVVQVRPHGTNSAAYDLASIQVLKGPQGTLFGRNTTGGAILFQPNKPTADLGGSVTVEGGNYNLKRGTAVLNLPLSDTLMVRLAGQITRRDGYTQNLTLGTDADDERTESARVSVRWKPTDRITNDFVFSFFHEDDHGSSVHITDLSPVTVAALTGTLGAATANSRYAVALASLGRQQARNNHVIESDWPSYSKINASTFANTTAIELSDALTVKNIFGYRHVTSRVAVDFDGSPAALAQTRNYMNADQITDEVQLVGKAGRLNWIGGLYYFQEIGDDIQYSIFPIGRINDGAPSNYSYSAYLQGGYALTDQLTLTAGARYTYDDRILVARSKTGSITPALATCRLTDTAGAPLNPCSKRVFASFHSPTWLISLDYKPNTDTLLYLSHRKGYRSGGWNLRSLTPSSFVPFRPENVYDIEAGFKLDLADSRVRINGAVYRQWYNDIQRAVSQIPPGQTLVVSSILNAGKATITGGEIEITLKPTELLELGANASVVDAKYTQFTDTLGDETYNKFAWAPKFQASGYVRLNLPLAQGQGDAGIQLGAYHQSSMQIADFNSPRPLKPYTLFDLTADWNRVMGSPFDVSVFVKNIADKQYSTSGLTQLPSIGPNVHAGLGFQGEMAGAPRTVGLSVRYHFGSGV